MQKQYVINDGSVITVVESMFSLSGPTMGQLEVFFSSDYLQVISPFPCFII